MCSSKIYRGEFNVEEIAATRQQQISHAHETDVYKTILFYFISLVIMILLPAL